MKYLLKTEVNGSGNKVFSKQRNGKVFVYLAKDENGNIGQVDKNWILRNQANIVNLGVSGDNIYPTEIKKETTEIEYDDLLDLAEEFYTSKAFENICNVEKYDIVVNYDNCWFNLNIERYIDTDDINYFNLSDVLERIEKTADFDVYEEACYSIGEGKRISPDIIERVCDVVRKCEEAKAYFQENIDELHQLLNDFKIRHFTQAQLDACAKNEDFVQWYENI